MGLREDFEQKIKRIQPSSERLNENLKRIVTFYYEPMLSQLELGKDQISTQSLDELKESLERVNEALINPDSFGTLRIDINAEGQLSIASPKSDYKLEIGIAPTLIERKKSILGAIKSLASSQKIEAIGGLVEQIPNGEIKEKLEQELTQFRSENHQIYEQQKLIETEQEVEKQKTQAEVARLSVELFERRSKVWFSLLERESAATILGGFLLIVIIVVHATAIFAKFSIPEILNNAFLIILGYFFGQSTNQAK